MNKKLMDVTSTNILFGTRPNMEKALAKNINQRIW